MAQKLIIVGIGDSTTAGTPGFMSPVEEPPEGVGDPESQYSYWMMKAHPEWTVLNRGVNGERSDQILSRFERDVVAVKPSIVIVLAGVNDIYQGLASDSVKINLEAMYALAESKGIVPVAATVLPYNVARPTERNSIQEVNAWIAKASSVPGRLFCDTNLAVREEDDPDFLDSSRDGLHPDVEGYRRMGAALSATLEKAGY
jgi:acyl-CoA thioesterase-1